MSKQLILFTGLLLILATTFLAVGCDTKSTATPYVAEEFAICTNTSFQHAPAISGHTVIWIDERNGNWDIYGYDLETETEFPICTNTGNQSEPAISDNIVVWQDDRNGNEDIYSYDLTTETEFAVCTVTDDQSEPAISDNIVVWTDYRTGNSVIYGYNLSSGEESPIGTNDCNQSLPAISVNTVVWIGTCDGDFCGYDLDTKEKFTIYNYGPSRLDISGDIVITQEHSYGKTDIYGYNLSSGDKFAICTAADYQFAPAISGNIGVWHDWRNGPDDIDIYGYNLDTGKEFAVCTNTSGQGFAAISGDIVVWMDGRNGNSDIYGARLTFDNE